MATSGKGTQLRLLLVATVCGATLFALAAVEGILRLTGHHPDLPGRPRPANEPIMNMPDPVLGWRMKPGTYRFPGYAPAAPPITMTIWPNGARATQADRMTGRRQIVLIGDSFTNGWAISDNETYGWNLQVRYPGVEVVNYGTAGYNGVQSLLRLEEHFKASPEPPEVIIYGMNHDQERRNVGEATWLKLLALASRQETVRLPYCLLDDRRELVIHSPEGYPMWPLRHQLSVVALLEDAMFRFRTRGRTEQERPATEHLLDRMNATAHGHGSQFVVVLLEGESSFATHYTKVLSARGVLVLDCRPGSWNGLMVPGEGHPNNIANALWATCISRKLDIILSSGQAD